MMLGTLRSDNSDMPECVSLVSTYFPCYIQIMNLDFVYSKEMLKNINLELVYLWILFIFSNILETFLGSLNSSLKFNSAF